MRIAFLSCSLALAATLAARPGIAAPEVRAAAPVGKLLEDPSLLARWLAKRSAEVAGARADLEAARAESRNARLLPNPTLDFSVSNFAVGDTNPKGLGLDRTLIYGLGLSETVELGKRGPRRDAADQRVGAARARVGATLGERVAEARLALGRVVYTQARAKTLDDMLSDARKSAEIAKGRLDHQALSAVDYDRLLLDLSALESEAARSHADAEAASSACTAALVSPCDVSGASVLHLDAQVPDLPTSSRLDTRADLTALRMDAAAARHDARLAARRIIPDPTIRLGYTRDTFTVSGDNANTLSLSVTVPLPLFDHGQHDQAKALALSAALEQRLRATRLQAESELSQLMARKRALEKTLSMLDRDSLPRAENVLKAQEKGLAEGQLDTTDLLLTRRQAIALRLQALDLRFELFGIKNEIRRTLGLDESGTW
jgi:cobalt-zinc-cadmium efflux system outer membrane protein